MKKGKTETIIFDLGGVLIDWNPRYVYRQIFDSEEKIDWFLTHICDMEWNEQQDAGRSLDEATAEKLAEFPEYEEEIKAYYGRWEEMLGGLIEESIQIFNQLLESGKYRLFGLTNWSAETFPIARERFEFLKKFDGIVVSGEEKTRKPLPEIYQIIMDRYGVRPEQALFIDDSLRNVKAAQEMGIESIHFTSSQQLKSELKERELI